jgi:hypothetical protein
VTGEAATVDTEAAKNFIPELKKMVEKGVTLPKKCLMLSTVFS